ncbi:MAG: hypothetical protein KGZ25_04120 [Planctomycetes bacterium]|nr:hypothetical protein [Planctomycetota bacterium]
MKTETKRNDGCRLTTEWVWMLTFAVSLLVTVSGLQAGQVGVSGDKNNEAPTPERVQSAIEGGLNWLAEKQVTEGPNAGSWQAPRYPTAASSFAGLAFLANGHLPGKGEYGPTVERTMRYVQDSMTPDGYLGARGDSMYVHAICTLFGLSYMGMTEDEKHEKELAEWGRKSIELILRAQKVQKRSAEQGGWRYSPYSAVSDMSVTSWQLLALHAARQCGYNVPDEAFQEALEYVNGGFVETDDGEAGFVYRPGVSKRPEPGVTGAALFVKRVLEEELDSRARKGIKLLRQHPPSWGGKQYKGYFFFGMFYMEQGLFQVGGEPWRQFYPAAQKVLLENQQGDGHWGFPPDNKTESRMAGEAYSTAMAVLILSLDKQYLPMYQRQKRLY